MQISDDHSIIRYCSFVTIRSGNKIAGTAFELKKKRGEYENYLSVDFFEFFQTSNADRYANIMALLRKRFDTKDSAVLARLKVGSVRKVKKCTPPIKVEYLSKKSDSYSGVYFPLAENIVISELLAEQVFETKPFGSA